MHLTVSGCVKFSSRHRPMLVLVFLAAACIGPAAEAQSLPGFPPPLGTDSPPSLLLVYGEADEATALSIVSAIEAGSEVLIRALLDVDVDFEAAYRGGEPIVVVGGPNENSFTGWVNSMLYHPFTIDSGRVSFRWCNRLEVDPGTGMVQLMRMLCAPALLVAGLSSDGTARAATALLSGHLGPLSYWESPTALIQEEAAEIMRPIEFSRRPSVYPSRWPARFSFKNGVLDVGLGYVELAGTTPRVVIVLSALVSGSCLPFPTGWVVGGCELPMVIPLSGGRLAVMRVDANTGVVEVSVECEKLIPSPDSHVDSDTMEMESPSSSPASRTVVLEPGSMLGPFVYLSEWRTTSADSVFSEIWIGTTEVRVENVGVGVELILPGAEWYTWDEGFVVLLFRSEDAVQCYVERYPSLGQW